MDTFCKALRCGNSAYCWKTSPARRCCGDRSSPRWLSNQTSGPMPIRPRRLRLFSKPAMARSKLVLPLPDGPTSATSSPAAHLKLASSRIGVTLCRATSSVVNPISQRAVSTCQRSCNGRRRSAANTRATATTELATSSNDIACADPMSKAWTRS